MVNRGEIWWADLPDPDRSQPCFRRPVAVVQADSFNHSNIQTVICAVITSNLALAGAPGNIFLPATATTLPKDSVLNISQIITIDKSFLTEKVGVLNHKQLLKLEESLKLVLSIK